MQPCWSVPEPFSPRVEDQSSDSCFTCVIDIAGTETLFGSPDALGESLLKKTQALGIRASIAISSNFHAAGCLARGHSGTGIRVVPRGMECTALAPLPLTVLDLSPEHTETFSMWGITTLGALGNLAETELIARLGQAGKELRLLARGESPHLFTALEPSFVLEERMELDSPVELLDSLLFIIGVMLDQLIVRAQSRILSLASITLHLGLEGGTVHSRTVRPALPNNDRKLWLKLIHLDLQAHPPQAAILSLTLERRTGQHQQSATGIVFSPSAGAHAAGCNPGAAFAVSSARAAWARRCSKTPIARMLFVWNPLLCPLLLQVTAKSGTKRLAMRQLRPPEIVMVNVHERQPDSFVFREKRYTVERAYGPWSSAGDWWNPTLWSLEQWDLVARSHDCCLALLLPDL